MKKMLTILTMLLVAGTVVADDAELTRLRAENTMLKRTIERLREQVAELEAKLAETPTTQPTSQPTTQPANAGESSPISQTDRSAWGDSSKRYTYQGETVPLEWLRDRYAEFRGQLVYAKGTTWDAGPYLTDGELPCITEGDNRKHKVVTLRHFEQIDHRDHSYRGQTLVRVHGEFANFYAKLDDLDDDEKLTSLKGRPFVRHGGSGGVINDTWTAADEDDYGKWVEIPQYHLGRLVTWEEFVKHVKTNVLLRYAVNDDGQIDSEFVNAPD